MAQHSGFVARLASEDKAQLLERFSDEYSPLVKLAKAIGPEGIDRLLLELGGSKPHIPTPGNFWSLLAREARDEEIRARFTGNNYAQLSMEYGLCERQLREIMAASHRKYVRLPEPKKTVHVPDTHYQGYADLAAAYGVPVRRVLECVLETALDADVVRGELERRFGGQLGLKVA